MDFVLAFEFLQRQGDVEPSKWVMAPPRFRKIGPKTREVRRKKLRPDSKPGGYPDHPAVANWGIGPISADSAAKLASLSPRRPGVPPNKARLYARLKHFFGCLEVTVKNTEGIEVLDPFGAETEEEVILGVVAIGKKVFEALSDAERQKLIEEAQPLRKEIIAAGRPRFS